MLDDAHPPWNRDHISVIRADIPPRLKKNEEKLVPIKQSKIRQIILYPYMRRLQNERNELLSDPNFLWMLQEREKREDYWRGWYHGVVYNKRYHYFIVDDDGPLCMPDLDEEFRVDLLSPILNSRQQMIAKVLGLLLGIYMATFLIVIGLCSLATTL